MNNIRTLNARRMLVELADGEVVFIECNPPAQPALTAPVQPAEEKPKKRGWGGRKKAATAQQDTTQQATAQQATAQPAPAQKATYQRPKIWVPIEECLGTLEYEKNGGGSFTAAVWKVGENKKGLWILCLFITKDGKHAFAQDKGFFANKDKVLKIDIKS